MENYCKYLCGLILAGLGLAAICRIIGTPLWVSVMAGFILGMIWPRDRKRT